MKKLNQLKIRVTPEQSEKVQIQLFKNGISWKDEESTVRFVSYPFLIVSETGIGFLPITQYAVFNSDERTELSFEEFELMYSV